MPIAICGQCRKYCPDGYHNWPMDQICSCLTKEEHIARAKSLGHIIILDGKKYDFYKNKKEK